MTFLPIVQRELRQATRKRSTFRVRWWSAVVAIVSSSVASAMFVLGAGRSAGRPLFGFLTVYAFSLCLLAGVFLTATALTEEKRQGTLGLLFLTDLHGYDVVLGKFAAASLNAVYTLVALLPVMAVPVLLGGISGAEFWRMCLALVNALFFSLAAGLCISAFACNSWRAMGNTLGLLLLFCAGLPAMEYFGARLGLSRWWRGLTWFSPASAVIYSGPGRAYYWLTLLGSHLAGWGLLAAASWGLPRLWYERDRSGGGWRWGLPARRSLVNRTRTRKRWMSRSPIAWLVYDQIGIVWGAWAVVLGWGVVTATILILFPNGLEKGAYWIMPFGFLLKILFALQACRFLVAARQDGALELLLCTGLSDRELVRGQSLGLWRSFLWPLVSLVVLMFVPILARLVTAWRQSSFEPLLSALSGSLFCGLYAVRLMLDLFALCWFGMAMALTLKRPHLAPGLTILYVLVLPCLVALCWLDILADIFFISWGISKLQPGLRRVVAHGLTVSEPVTASPLVPPVISY